MAATTSVTKPRGRWRAWLARLRRLFGVLLAFWLLTVMGLLAAIFLYSRVDQAQAADVIVVLGAGLQPDNRPGPALVRRTAKAAVLWQEGMAPQILCSGGIGLDRTRSEADACAELLRNLDVPASAIVLEDQSRSTEENALYTLDIMQTQEWQSVVMVSDGYHLLRANWLFNRLGIVNYPSPADSPPLMNLVLSSLREIIAFHWLVFKFLFNLSVTYVPAL